MISPAKIQKRIRYTGAVLFLLMNMFPPWCAAINPPTYPEKVLIGYYFITSPPQSPFGYQSYIVIDFQRLIIQWVIFIILFLVAHYAVGPVMKKIRGV